VDTLGVEALRSELIDVLAEGTLFFHEARHATDDRKAAYEKERWSRNHDDSEFLTESERETGQRIRKRLTDIGRKLIEAAKYSPLLEQSDESEIRRLLRSLCAALLLKEYTYRSSEVVSDEDRVLGITPAEHEEEPRDVEVCNRVYDRSAERLLEMMDLFAPGPDTIARAIVSSQTPSIQKYRPNTAFIMMQISDRIAELEDVKNCIKETFKAFGIVAIRSDEIEHSDVITQRILDEIATSEFLIADLTGERPSVYYELGYAHALGKRPILYRKQGTRLHFDLLVHNVPEYKNTTDLKAKLRERLAAVTNRSPRD
jgi:hypothetical protein